MQSGQAKARLDADLEAQLQAQAKAVDRQGIAEIVQNVLDTLQGDLTKREIAVHKDLEALAELIQQAKRDIAALRPEDIKREHIPQATDELDAVVAATEKATEAILDAAERIEEIARGLDGEQAKALADSATRIYEACNFQDITGQRVSKVVATLRQIEDRVGELVAAVGGESGAANADRPRDPAATKQADELLHGPQLPANAISQEDVDAFFSGGD